MAAPTQTLTPIVASDDLAIYRAALIVSHQNDLALLDRPTRYDLTLTYTPAPPTLAGSQDVRYFNRQNVPLDEIYLRLFANYPDSGGKISVDNLRVNGALASYKLEAQNTALRVLLDKPLAPNAALNLHLDFIVTIPRNNQKHYADFTANEGIATLPTMYPLIPAYDAKGWHIQVSPSYGDWVYADASLYAVTMTVPTTMTVIASGSTIGARDNGDGTTTSRIIGAPMRDFDINITSRLQKVSASVGDTTVNSWFEPTDAEAGKNALQYATDALRVFNNRFGAYPFRELDVAQTPTTAGGIEYPGIVVIGSELYRGARNRDFFEFAIVHEVAHQWWYAMVGNDQPNQPWVDEALAQYSALIYYEEIRGAGARQAIQREVFQGQYNSAKNAGHDMPANLPVAAYNEENYAAIVYGKAPLFFDAIRAKMGDARFFQFLRTYFERYRYRIATGDDLLWTAEDVCACSLQNEYKEWILSPVK
jgi:hypothetical protein